MASEQTESGGAALAQSSEKCDWRGHWIWTDAAAQARNAYAFFRREFITGSAGTLSLDITADSVYWLHVDDQFIARGPARAPLSHYLFDSFRLELPPGTHAVAVLVHHVGEVNACMMLGRPGLLAEVIWHPQVGGDATDLSTSAAWRCLPAAAWRADLPCTMSHFGFWEECDLRRLPAAWTAAAAAAECWRAAVEVGTPPCLPWMRLLPRDIPMPEYRPVPVAAVTGGGTWQAGAADAGGILAKTVAARRRACVSAPPLRLPYPLATGAGHWVTVDFGRTVSGYVEFEVEGAADGQCVDLSYDEIVAADGGSVNPERSYAHLSDRFLLQAGNNRVRTRHPRGFRYVMFDFAPAGPGARLTRVGAVEETYPFLRHGRFQAALPDLAAFYHRAVETVRICTTDAFTDCPARERVQWMEDLYMHALTAMYACGDTAMARHALFQAAQGALPDGRINGFFPSERTNCAFASSSLMWLALLADYRAFCGAENDVRRLLPTARRLLDLMGTLQDADGLLTRWPAGQFWDWAPIEGDGCLLLTNAFFLWCVERLGHDELLAQAVPPAMAKGLTAARVAAHARFWGPADGFYRDAIRPDGTLSPLRSQQANLAAVLAGICPAAERTALLRRLIDPANLGPVPVGEQSLREEMRAALTQVIPVGTLWFGQWLCRALFEQGLHGEALAQMQGLWGGYGSLATFPETRIRHGNTGHCHGWASGPAYLLPRYVLGLAPAAPGWAVAAFSPCPGGLAWAEGAVRTPRGELAVGWRREGDGVALEVAAPAGMRVQVRWGAFQAEVAGGTPWRHVLPG